MKLTRSVQVWGISVIHKHESCFSYIVLSSGSLENAEVLRFPLDADASKWLFLLALYLCWRLSLAIQFHWENWSDYPLLRCSVAPSLRVSILFLFFFSLIHVHTPPHHSTSHYYPWLHTLTPPLSCAFCSNSHWVRVRPSSRRTPQTRSPVLDHHPSETLFLEFRVPTPVPQYIIASEQDSANTSHTPTSLCEGCGLRDV